MSSDRVLGLEGVHNFRDYGGYPVAGGGRLKRGILWRSGQHYAATDADLEKIAALDLASVFDLRSSQERSTHPCRRPRGFSAEIHMPDEPQKRSQAAPHVDAAVSGQSEKPAQPRRRSAEETREGLRRNYGMIAFRPELTGMMSRFLAELAGGKGASLVNCMAGKDRTGIAVAVLQLATGVHRDDVIEDYLLTNTAGDAEARIAAGAETIRSMTGDLDDEVLRVIMGVEAEYLENAFAMMEERHGSVEGYLRDVLGVDEALKARLREALLEN